MGTGQRGTDLIGERDRQQPLLQSRSRTRHRSHQEPALEDTAAFGQQLAAGFTWQAFSPLAS
jgi:hypothetical protein